MKNKVKLNVKNVEVNIFKYGKGGEYAEGANMPQF